MRSILVHIILQVFLFCGAFQILFSQNETISVSLINTTFVRNVPLTGFNASTIDGPTWTMKKFNAKVASLKPQNLRYPGGEIANYWDWEKGWLMKDEIPISWLGFKFKQALKVRYEELKLYTDMYPTEIIHEVNMLTSTLEKEVRGLKHAQSLGFKIKYVELGNEFSFEHSKSPSKFKTAQSYALESNTWIKVLKKEFPGVQVGVVAGNFKQVSRSENWNNELLESISGADALIFHIYIYRPVSNKNTEYYDFMKICYDRFKSVYKNQGISESPSKYQIWLTEYNMFQKSEPENYTRRWAHSMVIFMMNSLLLDDKKITIQCFHDIASWTDFATFDWLDPEYPLTAGGVAMKVWLDAIHDATSIQKMEFTPEQTITVTNTKYPKVLAWKIIGNGFEKILIINFFKNPYSIDISGVSKKNNSTFKTYFADENKYIRKEEDVSTKDGNVIDKLLIEPISITVVTTLTTNK